MENMTFGQRIAQLRRKRGMTQRELGEKLNVSDKTISHWECDESAPDLATLPLLSDALECELDEIVRGRKSSSAANPAPGANPAAFSGGDASSPRGETGAGQFSPPGDSGSAATRGEHRRTTCRILTVVSCALSVVAFLTALICNFAFYRARLGFFVGCGLFTAAATIACISLTLCISGRSSSLGSVFTMGSISIPTILVLLSATIPLILYAPDATVGLSGSILVEYQIIYASVGAFASFLARRAAEVWLKHSGKLPDSGSKSSFRVNCAVAAAVCVVAVTMLFQASFNANAPWGLVKGTEYTDFETFRAYAETPTRLEVTGHTTRAIPVTDGQYADEVTYFDKDGNEIPAEIALRESVTVNGETYEWTQYNVEIEFVEFSDDGSVITVETVGDWERAREEQAQTNSLYRLGIIVESLSGIALAAFLSRYRPAKQTAA